MQDSGRRPQRQRGERSNSNKDALDKIEAPSHERQSQVSTTTITFSQRSKNREKSEPEPIKRKKKEANSSSTKDNASNKVPESKKPSYLKEVFLNNFKEVIPKILKECWMRQTRSLRTGTDYTSMYWSVDINIHNKSMYIHT